MKDSQVIRMVDIALVNWKYQENQADFCFLTFIGLIFAVSICDIL